MTGSMNGNVVPLDKFREPVHYTVAFTHYHDDSIEVAISENIVDSKENRLILASAFERAAKQLRGLSL